MEDTIAAAIRIAADVLCSGDERADFLKWWLDTYGTQPLSSSRDAWCPIFPDYSAPTSEAELDWLDAKFNRQYPEVVAIRRHRKCCCTPRRKPVQYPDRISR